MAESQEHLAYVIVNAKRDPISLPVCACCGEQATTHVHPRLIHKLGHLETCYSYPVPSCAICARHFNWAVENQEDPDPPLIIRLFLLALWAVLLRAAFSFSDSLWIMVPGFFLVSALVLWLWYGVGKAFDKRDPTPPPMKDNCTAIFTFIGSMDWKKLRIGFTNLQFARLFAHVAQQKGVFVAAEGLEGRAESAGA